MPRQEFEVVGVAYRVTPTTLAEMEKFSPIEAYVKRQRDNPEDENAIAVYLDERPWKKFHIGYLRAVVAQNFAPLMDSGSLKLEGAYVFDFDVKTGRATISFDVKNGLVEPKISS